MQQFIEYNTGVKHRNDADTKIDIPSNLLKISDLRESYRELLAFQSFITEIQQRNVNMEKAEE